MSKSSSKKTAPETASLLPIPNAVVEHHGATLFEMMKNWQNTGQIPPVLLISGQAGVGKRSMGYFLAEWILCEKSGFASAAQEESSGLFGAMTGPSEPQEKRLTPCGVCLSCQRALKNSWVDFTEILPEEEDESRAGTLKIDQFRNLKSQQGFGAHEGKYKIILIPNVDRMTVQAANSLLKILEEPPKGWIFFLTASDTTLLLPTLISRCQKIKLKPFHPAALKTLLTHAKTDRIDLAIALASGSWGKALSLTSDEVWDQRPMIFSLLRDPANAVGGLVDWAVMKPANFNLLLDQYEQICADLLKWSTSENRDAYAWANRDGKAALTDHAKKLEAKLGVAGSREFWHERAERIGRARGEALAPLNRKSLVQDLLLPWLAVQAS